ncbi:MAG: 50S ribosomal protein L11 methyltransferase [Gemmatimonadota bacterium]
MTWWAIDVSSPTDERESLAAWLVTRTGQAVEERDDGILVSFALNESAADTLVAELSSLGRGGVTVSRRPIAEVDWANKWREGLGPRSFGRLTVVPSWFEYRPRPGEVTLVLDPESAFGSGEHGSTRAALQLLERHMAPGDFVLDFGSGSGILSIGAALLGASRAVGLEQDAESVEVSQRNALANRVAERALFFEADAGQFAILFAPANLVVSNILRSVNIALLPEIWRALHPGGIAIFSGMEATEAPEFRAPLVAAGFEIVEEIIDAGWWAVAARRT